MEMSSQKKLKEDIASSDGVRANHKWSRTYHHGFTNHVKVGGRSEMEEGRPARTAGERQYEEIQIACDKVKELEYLREGFNIFAVFQGTLIARGLIQFCEGAPPVKNFISLAGPQAGVAAIPFCENIFGILCPVIQAWFNGIVYTEEGQDFAAAATYYKLPNKIEEYLKYSRFLPKLNNERPGERNSTYKERFSSLHNLVLLANENENVLIPKESAWFGYYKDGSTEGILPAQEIDLYKEDWIGLRSLNEVGRVRFEQVPGAHAEASDETLSEFVVPFLVDWNQQQPSTMPMPCN
ncbi:palmitoyl-protein thioesterase 1-like [Momordica charantia]|uniref:Palmitoyl-protein thioesterase 1-like n=1 Tax=Momordica charantia TaxID=3673 RepID=A0A6J1DUW7_MOMCH|nr:palmitoyl-protein thioesterase 1-like [Momordica charantia]